MAKGRQREVPETLHNSAWAWDFFSVTTHILPSWTASYKISSKTLLQNRALSYRDVGNAFRNELQDAEATKGRVARGAFSASYAGEDPRMMKGTPASLKASTHFRRREKENARGLLRRDRNARRVGYPTNLRNASMSFQIRHGRDSSPERGSKRR
ncbi:hypothetical protein FOXYSP1_16879 [Fusarium oxysporum f. sp. phaseoli]